MTISQEKKVILCAATTEKEVKERSFHHRLSTVIIIARTFQSAELIGAVETIEELIKSGELEKAEKELSKIEKQAEEIKQDRVVHPYETNEKKALHHYVAYKIADLRRRKKMSQAELARKVGINEHRLAKIEQGQKNVTIDELQKIAKALDSDLKINLELKL